MKTIRAFKAQPTIKDEPVESIQLVIDEELPHSDSLEQACERHKLNAKRIMRALSNLPQGTRHELLILMLKEKQCLFTIK